MGFFSFLFAMFAFFFIISLVLGAFHHLIGTALSVQSVFQNLWDGFASAFRF